jgi:SAM-dependent methyltransferase
MRRDWDDRARQDAFHYIASWRTGWTAADFLDSGEKDFSGLVQPMLESCGLAAAGNTMVELGCGAGRMTGAFAKRYARVYGLDLSAEMLRRARELHPRERNILWMRVSGADLACIQRDSADLVFSYLVLQHVPSSPLALAYIREILRIVRPGGAFLFQFAGKRVKSMNLRGRLAWGAIDSLWSLGWTGASRRLASFAGFEPVLAGRTWRGTILPEETVVRTVTAAGGEVRATRGGSTEFAWCCGVKKATGAVRAC